MTRTTRTGFGVLLAAIILVAMPLLGDPPIRLGPDSITSREVAQELVSAGAIPCPRLTEYSNGGCKDGPGGEPVWPCGDDTFEFSVTSGSVHVIHRDATYNCCPDDIAVSLTVEGATLRFSEEEILTAPCDCWCCYDVEATAVGLAPGTYTVEYSWFDYEAWDWVCSIDEIVVPSGSEGPPGGGGLRGEPPIVVGRDPGASSPVGSVPSRLPRVGEYGSFGCLDDPDDPHFPPCGADEIVLTVDDGVLHVLHNNATYNCCLDAIEISMDLEDHRLLLTEEEILTNPCWCICCYDVAATIIDLAPGTYTVEFTWFDYDTDQIESYVEDIVIP